MSERHVIGAAGNHAGVTGIQTPVLDGLRESGVLNPGVTLTAEED